MTRRKRLAYFSPLPPAHTGVADHARELVPALTQQADVTLYSADPASVDLALKEQCPIRPLTVYRFERWNYDAAIFHMGNSSFHAELYQTFCHYPGIVVLHDFSLHHFMVERSLQDGHYVRYRRELAYALGHRGIQIGQDVQQGQCSPPLYEWPLNNRLIDLSLGLIAHSNYIATRVQQQRSDLLVRVIPQPKVRRPISQRRSIPDWPNNSLVFASAGQITPSRQIELALRAFAEVRKNCPAARYLIVGEWRHPELNLDQLVRELQLQEVVHHIDFVEDLSEFDSWIASIDILVNLRYPTVGETSGVVLRALAAGVPIIVWNSGWYSELPERCGVKVTLQDFDALVSAMLELALNIDKRQRLGQQAAQYAWETFDPGRVAAQYLDFVEEYTARL